MFSYSLYHVNILDCFSNSTPEVGDPGDPNADNKLTDFSSAMVMERNGWKLNIRCSMTSKFSPQCGRDTWFGYNYAQSVGSVQTMFQGTGKATLNFGNCYGSGHVIVYLNGREISRANAYQPRIDVEFQYSKGDILYIVEVNTAIIKLNSLHLYRIGIPQMPYHKCHKCII